MRATALLAFVNKVVEINNTSAVRYTPRRLLDDPASLWQEVSENCREHRGVASKDSIQAAYAKTTEAICYAQHNSGSSLPIRELPVVTVSAGGTEWRKPLEFIADACRGIQLGTEPRDQGDEPATAQSAGVRTVSLEASLTQFAGLQAGKEDTARSFGLPLFVCQPAQVGPVPDLMRVDQTAEEALALLSSKLPCTAVAETASSDPSDPSSKALTELRHYWNATRMVVLIARRIGELRLGNQIPEVAVKVGSAAGDRAIRNWYIVADFLVDMCRAHLDISYRPGRFGATGVTR